MSCRFLRLRLWIWAVSAAVFAGCWLLVSPIEFVVALVAALVLVASMRVAFDVAESIVRSFETHRKHHALSGAE